ncbi:MAG: hypothetical protein FWD48_05675 [Oscillospiraceae bacterium]|nr:hypothetical protein [Oscillospiraceae bacterium]
MSTIHNMVTGGAIVPKNASKEEAQELQAQRLASIQQSQSGLFSSLGSNNNNDRNQTGMDFFFGAGSAMSSVTTMNSARLGIENRARTLLSEIRMDQLRGVDTSYKREQLEALTGNLDIMNKNLDNNVGKALDPAKPREAATPIIDKINAQLKTMQEKEEKKVQDKYGKRDEPKEPVGENTEPEATTGTETEE